MASKCKTFSYIEMLKLIHLKDEKHYPMIHEKPGAINRILRANRKQNEKPKGNIEGFRKLVVIEIE